MDVKSHEQVSSAPKLLATGDYNHQPGAGLLGARSRKFSVHYSHLAAKPFDYHSDDPKVAMNRGLPSGRTLRVS